MNRLFSLAATLAATACIAAESKMPISPTIGGRENTEWSTFYSFHVTDKDKNLPRVLLVGDSITGGYQSGVRAKLEGKAAVSYWISSYGINRPEYADHLEMYLSTHEYDIVHFNNGLHGTQGDWGEGLERALATIRRIRPKAKVIWATSTPLKTGTNERIAKMNAKGREIATKAKVDAIDDLFAVCDPLDREKNWRDQYHFKPAAVSKLVDQVSNCILSVLAK